MAFYVQYLHDAVGKPSFGVYCNKTVLLFSLLQKQVHLFQQALMFGAGFHNIDAGRFDAGMTQQVRQLGKIFFDLIEGPGKQVPQVVGKDLFLRHTGLFAQGLHLFPDRDPVQRVSCAGHKHRPPMDALAAAPPFQPLAQGRRLRIA